MLRRRRIRIAGSQISPSQHCNHDLDELMVYHDSNIVADFRLILCNVQTSNELCERVPKGYLGDFANMRSSELTSGANCGKRKKRIT